MLKFTYIVGYTSCGPTYIESFFTLFGQCINVLNYNRFLLDVSSYAFAYVARENQALYATLPCLSRKIASGLFLLND